jgi:protocatechuate 3,4-dioxygenase alpha subunit
MRKRPLTASQTVGPFFAIGLLAGGNAQTGLPGTNVLVEPDTEGTRIRILGHVYDGEKAPVPDAVVEIWQANAAGQYAEVGNHAEREPGTAFTGFGRCGTGDDGSFSFDTIKPGAVPFEARHGFSGREMQAPHICIAVFARGLLNHLYTRIYFGGEPANASDPVLQCVPAERRNTLIAQAAGTDTAGGIANYTFNIILQGAGETVFFNL